MNKFYVYVYLNPLKKGTYTFNDIVFDYAPFYIGKGCGDRYKQHLRESSKNHNKHKDNTIEKIKRELNTLPIIKIIYNQLEENEALLIESEMINHFGRKNAYPWGILTNLTDGGRGGTSGTKHPPRSKEWKRKQRESHLGNKFSDEVKQRLSEMRLGNKHWNYGNTTPTETRNKISEGVKLSLDKARYTKQVNIYKKRTKIITCISPCNKRTIIIDIPTGSDIVKFLTTNKLSQTTIKYIVFNNKSGDTLKQGKAKGWTFIIDEPTQEQIDKIISHIK